MSLIPINTHMYSVIDAIEGIDENSIIVSIGGHEGIFCKYVVQKHNPFLNIFEPIPKFYNELVSYFSGNPKIHIYQMAIGSKYEKRKLYTGEPTHNATFYKGWMPKIKKKIMVNVCPLEHFINAEKISLLTLNCEGSEYDIMDYLINTGYINKIEKLLIQFHKIAPNSEDVVNGLINKMELSHKISFNLNPWTWILWEKK